MYSFGLSFVKLGVQVGLLFWFLVELTYRCLL